MHRVLETLEPVLPRETPRYLMGVGFPADLLEGIARGVDLFDCVAATRNGRHGTAWVADGRVNVRGAALKGSTEEEQFHGDASPALMAQAGAGAPPPVVQ